MSKKKSLGSSPIGFKSKSNSMSFIPDLGVSKSKNPMMTSSQSNTSIVDEQGQNEDASDNKTEKKIVSYNLEIDLIEKVKIIASQKEMYYSTLVSTALKNWLAENA